MPLSVAVRPPLQAIEGQELILRAYALARQGDRLVSCGGHFGHLRQRFHWKEAHPPVHAAQAPNAAIPAADPSAFLRLQSLVLITRACLGLHATQCGQTVSALTGPILISTCQARCAPADSAKDCYSMGQFLGQAGWSLKGHSYAYGVFPCIGAEIYLPAYRTEYVTQVRPHLHMLCCHDDT